MRKTMLTGNDVIAVLFITVFIAMSLFAATSMQQEFENRVNCALNLKRLGTAMAVYANDYEDQYPRQGANSNAIWSEKTDGWDNPAKNWYNTGDVRLTVGASLYLLVRYEDVRTDAFVCPSGIQVPYDGQNNHPANPDLVELWDFGSIDYRDTGPKNCVSYSYQLPYSRHAATGSASASFATMADKNPWYDSQLRAGEATDFDWKNRADYIVWDDSIRGDRDWQLQVGNAHTHLRDGQNIIYADGHCTWESRPDVGVRHDNIYTVQIDSTNDGIRTGIMPDPFGIGYGEPKTSTDSYLVNDDGINPCTADQPGDLNRDCTVDFSDLAIIAEHWLESTKQD